MKINQLLQIGLKIKDESKNKPSIEHMKNVERVVLQFCGLINSLNLNISVKSFGVPHAKKCMNAHQEQNGYSDNTYNQYKGLLKDIVSYAIEDGHTNFNPFQFKNATVISQVRPFTLPTDSQYVEVMELLKNVNQGMYLIAAMIEGVGIRESEICRLKVNSTQIDIENNVITLEPEQSKSGRKTKKGRQIPILPTFKEILIRHIGDKMNSDQFLFSNDVLTGKNKFQIGNTPLSTKVLSDWWKLNVINKGYDFNLYGLKHYGGQQKILLGWPENIVKDLYGHTAMATTNKYIGAAKLKSNQNFINQFYNQHQPNFN